MRQIPDRIAAIASLVPPAATAADIGCDHGYLCLELLRSGRVRQVLACDISAPCSEKALELLRGSVTADSYEVRCGDGLQVLQPGEAEVIVITGMGGMRIGRLLSQSMEVARGASHLLLGPQKNAMQLRFFLAESGFEIERETVVEAEGRFYPMLLVRPGEVWSEKDDFWYFFGRSLLENPGSELSRFVDREIRCLETALAAGCPDMRRLSYLNRLREIRKDLS